MKHFRYLIYLYVFIGFSSAVADSYSEFFRAIIQDNPSSIQALLNRGFDPNSVDERGQPGISRALMLDSFDAALTFWPGRPRSTSSSATGRARPA